MVQFFPNTNAANDFMERHQELRPVSVSAGHSAGSVLVLFEAKPPEMQRAVSWAVPCGQGPPPELKKMVPTPHPEFPPGSKKQLAELNPQQLAELNPPRRRAAPKGKA